MSNSNKKSKEKEDGSIRNNCWIFFGSKRKTKPMLITVNKREQIQKNNKKKKNKKANKKAKIKFKKI